MPAVYLCCTFPGVTSGGRYPLPCPAQPGLSSQKGLSARFARLLTLLTPFIILKSTILSILSEMNLRKSCFQIWNNLCLKLSVMTAPLIPPDKKSRSIHVFCSNLFRTFPKKLPFTEWSHDTASSNDATVRNTQLSVVSASAVHTMAVTGFRSAAVPTLPA